MLRSDSNIRHTSIRRSQQKYLKLFTTLNDLSKFDLANPSDLELVGLLNFDPSDLELVGLLNFDPSDFELVGLLNFDPSDLELVGLLNFDSSNLPNPSDLPDPPEPPEPSDPPEPPDPAEPPEPLNPLNPLILTFCRTFAGSILLTQSAKLFQNMFAKYIGFSLKSRFLNNCIICNDDVIMQVFLNFRKFAKKQKLMKCKKKYCIVFKTNDKRYHHNVCLYLSRAQDRKQTLCTEFFTGS